ncbi:DUF5050 domain-containing protein [Clostridium sp. DJ247]|uniref:DUF5050 domain-containing protein n=1 Tax=Clostridium sp. DJ247 TaxID=2726188 RepID=UPI00162813ED|nr:DUF5050 domain-containing protein [Clostridium sp. DJ247]MBC2582120.1 DUF5050 domain-containing protein [Clostridium sp. DJ247]
MKKIKLLVASVVMALSFSTVASAALPVNSIIIGDKAYSVDYISKNLSNLSDILNNSTQYKNIYYVNSSNNVVNLFDGSTLSDLSNLSNSITYYDYNGNKTVYSFSGGSGGNFNQDSTSSVVNATINVTSIGTTMYFVSVKLPDASKVNVAPYTLTPKYFKVYNSNNSDLIKTIGTPDTIKGESDDAYTLNLVTTDLNIRLQILSSDKVPIATTSPVNLGATTYVNQGPKNVAFNLDNYFVSPTSTSYSNSNGLGNLNNTGLASQSGGWIYYSNAGDGGGIYKTNGVQSYKICEDNAKFINVVGDWIYYSNYSDNQKIYKVRTDGTGRRIVCTDQASYVVVSGEYIYYSYHSGTGVGNIRKINKDALKSPGTNITNDEAEFLTVSGDMIYYANKSEGNSIYTVQTNGASRTKISGDSAKFITFANNQIYYVTDLGQLKWISKTGGSFGSIQVSNGSTGSTAVIASMNITSDGKWMYYTDASDGNKIYRAPIVNYLKISGDKYADSYADFISLAGNNIYYTKGNSMFIANEPKIASGTSSGGPAAYQYTSTPVTKITQPLKIISYDKVATPTKNAVGTNTSNLEDYLPDKITAVLSDNSVHEVLVDWDLNPKQSGKGSTTQYTGTVVGYGSKVTLSLSMASEPIPAASVKVINNAGLLDDKVYVNKDDKGIEMSTKANLQSGDIIKIYRDASKSELLGQDTIIPSLGGGLLSSIITLSQNKTIIDDAKYVYVTRTSPGVLESDTVQVPISGVSGAPVFAVDPSVIKITNYGTLPNGFSENDIVEIPATTQLQQGDIVNVYKNTPSGKVKLASQMVQYVPGSDPFSPNKFAATISIPAGYIEYDTSAGADNNVYITKSNQFAESDWSAAIKVPFGQGVALPLGQLIVSGTASNVSVRTQLDTQYEYYYKVGTTIPELGEKISEVDGTPINGWKKLDKTNPQVIGIGNGDDVYVVQVYIDSSLGGKALRCSHATAVVTP